MSDIGKRLREAREQQGFSLDEVERKTRIRRVFLQAIEEERFDALPGQVYVSGFIRNYARFLGLDPQELLVDTHEPSPATTVLSIPSMIDEPLTRHAPRHLAPRIFLAVMVVLVVAAVAWYAYARYYLDIDPAAYLRDRLNLQQIPGMPTPDHTSQPTLTPTAPETRASGTSSVAGAAGAATETPASQTATPTASATARPTAVRSATPTPADEVRVVAHVLAPTYVEVTIDGEQVYVGTLQEGDDRTWTGKQTVALRVGNAGGLELTVNGVEVGALGEAGQVLNVEYNLDDLPR